jgi:hypothetical protein
MQIIASWGPFARARNCVMPSGKMSRLARADRNGDCRIEWDEMLAFAPRTPSPPIR